MYETYPYLRCSGNTQEQSSNAQTAVYLLGTSECADNPLLDQFDNTLRTGLIKILNVDLNEDQWIQAWVPVADGRFGIRSAQMLAPSAFLASAASTLLLLVHPPWQGLGTRWSID